MTNPKPGLSVYSCGSAALAEKNFLKTVKKEELEFVEQFLNLAKQVLLRNQQFGINEFAYLNNLVSKNPLQIEILRTFVNSWAECHVEQTLLTPLPKYIYAEDNWFQTGDITRMTIED